MANFPTTLASLSASLTSQFLPLPHPSFLTSILTPTSQTKPLAVLTATAKHRLLHSNISHPNILSPSTSSFPSTLTNVRIISTIVPQDVFVQVLDIVDIGSSLWSQIEGLESERKGETTKGREIIRVPPPSNNEEMDRSSTSIGTQTQTPAPQQQFAVNKLSAGPHKLLLQDVKGTKIWAFEMKKVSGIGIGPVTGGGGLSIGGKMWVKKGCKVARGMVLLEPGSCVVLGGKIEGLDKGWREGREGRLREEVGRQREVVEE